MKYAAAITLYNPTDEFINNLLGYKKSFPLVIVNDNSKDNTLYKEKLSKVEGILYFWDGLNYGLPYAFNRSLKICQNDNIDFLCTLDQDSRFSKQSISAIKEFIESNDMTQVGIVAPTPVDINSEVYSISAKHSKEVKWVICSGAFVNVDLLNTHDIKYDEAYFVDRFDADLCEQIYRAKLKQLLIDGVEMPHACGDVNGHSPLRNYYIFRNRFYFNDKYYNKVISITRSFFQTIRQCWSLYFSQHDGKVKAKMLRLAYKDYRRGCMGEIPADTLEMIKDITNEA